MVSISTKRPLPLLRPTVLGTGPVSAKELPDASIRRLLLRRLEGDQLIEILVNDRGFAITAMGRVRWTMPA